jgi:hypothetical protein
VTHIPAEEVPARSHAAVRSGARHRRPPKHPPITSVGIALLVCGLLATALGLGGWLLYNRGQADHPVSQPGRGQAGESGSGGLAAGAHAPAGRITGPAARSGPGTVARPVWLVIPAIGVSTSVVRLGLTAQNTLQVPPTPAVVGWYTGSPRPGDIGSSVIVGHIDSKLGPGVFFNLRQLKRGQFIYVIRANQTVGVFEVTSLHMYRKSRFPRNEVYGPVPDAELRLITCGGTFDYATGSYLSNVVAYADLIR